jgi:hypothetical protein
MKRLLPVLLLIGLSCFSNQSLFAQNIWKHYYGYPNRTWANDFAESYDGGYIFGGTIQRQNYYRTGWILKTDINGNPLYQIMIGDGAFEAPFFCFDKTSDGGFIAGGWYHPGGDDLDAYAMKFNACGEKEWCTAVRSPEGTQTSFDMGIHEVPGGGYIAHRTIASFANDDRVSLVKFSNDGRVEWVNAYANSTVWENETDHEMIVTSDTCFLISGWNYYPIEPGLLYISPYWYKVDRNGNLMWIHTWELKTYEDPGDALVNIEDKNGNYYSGGKMYQPLGHSYLFKLAKNGDTIARYKIIDHVPEAIGGCIHTLNALNDSTLIIGTQFGLTTEDNWWSLVKTDTLGNVLARKYEEDAFIANSSLITSDGKVLLNGVRLNHVGWAPTNTGLYKFNSNLEYDSIYTMPRNYDSLCPHPIVSDTIPMPDNCLIVSLPEELKPGEIQPLKLYPNPASDYLSVEMPEYAVTNNNNNGVAQSMYRPISGKSELVVYDVNGHLIYSESIEAGVRNHVIATGNWAVGMYMVELEQKGVRVAGGKVMKR